MPNDATPPVVETASEGTTAVETTPAPAPSLISAPPKTETTPPAAEATPPGETTPPTTPPVEPPAPVTREALTLPEGVEVDDETLNAFLETVNTDGLSRAEMAQKFIDLQLSLNEKASVAATEAAQSLWDTTVAEWISQCRALPEIGGDRLPITLEEINRGLVSAGAKTEFFQALDLTGAGSHPAIVAVMHKLVQPYLEKPPVAGDPPKGTLSAALKLYPTMAPKE